MLLNNFLTSNPLKWHPGSLAGKMLACIIIMYVSSPALEQLSSGNSD